MRWLRLEGQRLKARLLEAGLAPRYVRRVTRELSDHLSDIEMELTESGMPRADAAHEARRRLGAVDYLTSQVIARPPEPNMIARYPALAFSIGSFGAAAMLVMGTLAVFLLTVHALESFGYKGVRLGVVLSHCHYYFASYVAAPLMAAFMYWMAYWYRIRLRWAFLAAIVLALAGGVFLDSTLTYSNATPMGQHGTYSVGFGLYGHELIRSVWRLLSPLGLFAAFALWARTKGREVMGYRMEL